MSLTAWARRLFNRMEAAHCRVRVRLIAFGQLGVNGLLADCECRQDLLLDRFGVVTDRLRIDFEVDVARCSQTAEVGLANLA